MKSSDIEFDYIHLLFYRYHKINPSSGGSYIDPPDKKQKNNNPINKKGNKYSQYAVTTTLNYEETKKMHK